MRIDERNRRVQITRTESRVRTKKTQRRTFHTRSFELLLPQQPTCMIFLHATLSLSLSLFLSLSLSSSFSLSLLPSAERAILYLTVSLRVQSAI